MQNAYPNANHSTNSHNFCANSYNSKASSPKKDTYNQPKYISLFGCSAGIVLNQAMYWTKTKTAGEREGWFYKSVRQWCEETGLTTSQVRSGIARLKAFGVVETWVGGFDNVTWYKVDLAAVEAALKGGKPQKNLGNQLQSGLLPIAKRFAISSKPLYNELQKITSENTTNKKTVNDDALAVEDVVVFDLKEEKKACKNEASSCPNQEKNLYQTYTKPIPKFRGSNQEKKCVQSVSKVRPIFSGSNTSKIEDQIHQKTPKNAPICPQTANPIIARLQQLSLIHISEPTRPY